MRHSQKQRVQASKDRLDATLISDAKRFGHHGPANLIETVRQRHNIPLDPAYAEHLCREWGNWKAPAPPAP